LADQEQDSVTHSFHEEGGAIVFDKPPSAVEAARQRRENEQHEFAREQVKTNRRLAGFTRALVVATFCTIGVGIWQGSISQKAANAAGSAAATASDTLKETQANEKNSAQLAEQRFHIEQRPYLTVSDVKPNSPLLAGDNQIVLALYNSGKSPALDVRIQTSVFFGDRRIAKNPSKRSESIVGAEKPAFNTYTLSVNSEDFSQIATGKEQIRFTFVVAYTDIFKERHTTRACAYYNPKEVNYKYCEAGNSVE
jgi:hypothetical protein